MHPLEIAANIVKELVVFDEPYSITTASDEVCIACWQLCAEIDKLTDDYSFLHDTWVDSFLGFDVTFDNGLLKTIDGTAILGDSQRDVSFKVDRDSEGLDFSINFSQSGDRCRPYMFKFQEQQRAEQVGAG